MFISFSAMKTSKHPSAASMLLLLALQPLVLYLFIDSSVFVYPFLSFCIIFPPDFFVSLNYLMLHVLLFKVAVVPRMPVLPSRTGSLVSSFSTFQ